MDQEYSLKKTESRIKQSGSMVKMFQNSQHHWKDSHNKMNLKFLNNRKKIKNRNDLFNKNNI